MAKLRVSQKVKDTWNANKKKRNTMTNHDKRVAEWERRKKLFPLSCGSRPQKKIDFNLLRGVV